MHFLKSSLSAATSRTIEEHARQFVDNAPCGYLITDPNGQLLGINDTLLDWLGYQKEDLAGQRTMQDILNRGGSIYFDTHLAPLLGIQGEVREINLTLVRQDGSKLPVLISATHHVVGDGPTRFNSFVVTNFTDRKKYERELLEARKRAESSDRAKTSFLSTISHEVLTPLNAIIGTADLLGVSELDPNQRRLQSILIQSGNHLLSLFKNILIVAKSGLGELKVSHQPFSVRRLVQSIVDSFRYGSADETTSYTIKIDDRVPAGVVGDPTLFNQVLTNLIGNAAKFARGGKVCIAVEWLDQSELGHHLRFSVTDDGIGIHPEHLDKLFQPFSQATQHIHQKYGGSGLGLSICQRILDYFDSTVQVESTLGQGSRFWFEVVLPEGDIPPQSTLSIGDLPVIGAGRVLIVEDNRTNSFLVARYFRRWKVDFDLAANGKEALECVEANDYDLVLMDLKMPVMDGYTASKRIRSMPPPKNQVPIIAFSASARMAMTEKMHDAHIDDFALKPFDPRQLHAFVRRYLSPPAMNFPELRSTLDHDPAELEAFSIILQQELNQASDALTKAFADDDVHEIGDLKHKLKTTLQILEAETVKQNLQEIVDDLRAGRSPDKKTKATVRQELDKLSRRLARQRW
ncbi:hybrid sensor histidine kinase/response regulator [Neolewinella litorea]|uniref:histidine kinase n=1 Tax=Neolewinella litorea TaxID=2562452 RepID=A0A4V3XLD2_9BACT|nr:ATP-binding protein [Neolewinella litorea]THH40383.1 response regulator [Neolewinella litorea]